MNKGKINETKKIKIALCSINTRFSQSSTALDCLNAYLNYHLEQKNISRQEYEVKIFEFSLSDTYEYVTRTLCRERYDVYGFSIYIWNREFMQKTISFIKTAFPASCTIAGGPEVMSICQGDQDAMCGASFAISGEGEEAFARFIEIIIDAFKNNVKFDEINIDRLSEIPGMAITRGNGLIYSTEPAVVADIDKIPPVYRGDFENRNSKKNYIYYETSRGCPNYCQYCLSSLKPKGVPAVRRFSMERVFSDIDYIINVLKIDKVRVIDRTFNEDPDRALKILKYIVEKARPETFFQFEMSPYKFSDELLDFLKTLSRQYFQFEIGIQSFEKRSLDSVGRIHDESENSGSGEDYSGKGKRSASELLDILINETTLNIHADLMYGLPGDTYGGCVSSFDKLLDKVPDSVQFWQLKLLRGTRLRERAAENGLVYDQYPPYGVIKTKNMDVFDIFKLQKLGRYLDLIYNNGHLRLSVKLALKMLEKPSGLFFDLIEYFESHDIPESAISRQNLFLYFKDYCELKIKPMAEEYYYLLIDSLRYDFIKGETKRFSMPEFLKPQKHKHDLDFYKYVSARFAKENLKIKLSRIFSSFRFSHDIFNLKIGELKNFNMHMAVKNLKMDCYIILKHLVKQDGTFGSEKLIFKSEDEVLALDYFNYADKNKIEIDHDFTLNQIYAEKFKLIEKSIEKFKKYGIIV